LRTRKPEFYTAGYEDTDHRANSFGPHPSGYLSYVAACRMYGIAVRDGRKPLAAIMPTDREKIELFAGAPTRAAMPSRATKSAKRRHLTDRVMDRYEAGSSGQGGCQPAANPLPRRAIPWLVGSAWQRSCGPRLICPSWERG